jgi:hypothetical protein
MSIILPLTACLCAAVVLVRRRHRPQDVPVALDGGFLFDCLPGLILLRAHDIHLRAELALPVGRPSCLTVSGRRYLPEAV